MSDQGERDAATDQVQRPTITRDQWLLVRQLFIRQPRRDDQAEDGD